MDLICSARRFYPEAEIYVSGNPKEVVDEIRIEQILDQNLIRPNGIKTRLGLKFKMNT